MIDVDDMRAFQNAATLLNFSAAGRVLGVRKTAISRSIGRLEAVLHVRLFERTTREVRLTEAGRMLIERFDEILTKVDKAVDFAASLSVQPHGRLKVTAGIGFGVEVLTALLPRFSRRYPDIAVCLDLTSRTVDLIGEQVDVAFRMGPLTDSSLIASRLGTIGCVLCAAPAYINRRGLPQTVEELRSHELLSIPRGDGLPRGWSVRDPDGRQHRFNAHASLTANDPHALHRMVLNGAGIAASASFVAQPDIDRGRLTTILPGWSVPSVDVSIVTPGGRDRSPAARAFIDFVRDQVSTGVPWLER